MFKIILNIIGFFVVAVGYSGILLPKLLNTQSDVFVILGWVSIIPAAFLLKNWLMYLADIIFNKHAEEQKNGQV